MIYFRLKQAGYKGKMHLFLDEAVKEALGSTSTLLSAALACMGVGVYMLGSLKEERRR